MNINLLRWTLGLVFVLALVAATNLMDRQNVNEVSSAIETIYEDRLVAKDILFELSILIHEKELAIASQDPAAYAAKTSAINTKIDDLVALFATTKLTEEEAKAFDRLKRDILALEKTECRLGDESALAVRSSDKLPRQINDIQADLKVLSEIQIKEGRRQMLIGQSAMRSIDFLTSMEIYILIILGIVMQVLLFSGLRIKKFGSMSKLDTWSNN